MPRIPQQPGCDCHYPVSASEDIKLKILESNFDEKLTLYIPKDLKNKIQTSATESSEDSYLYIDDNGTPKKISTASFLALAKAIKFKKVSVLPEVGESTVIYLVPKSSTEAQNNYEEFIWVDNHYERIGSTSVDLSDYYKKSETDIKISEAISTKQDVINDLATIRSGAALGATAIQEHQDISGKANVGDSYLKAESDAKYLTTHQDISGKQDKLTAGSNISINGVQISSKEKLAEKLTATVSVGGVSAGDSFAAGTSVEEVIKKILEVPKILQRIKITTEPVKKIYTEGEVFDPTGMVVKAEYNIGEEVITNYTYSPSGALTTTDTQITISFNGKSTTQSITVNPAEQLKACFYEGATIPTEITSSWVIENITKGVLATGISHKYTGGFKGYLGVAYNKSLGSLIHVYQNNQIEWDLLQDMTRTEVTYNGNTYYMYMFTEKASLSDDIYDYLFK